MNDIEIEKLSEFEDQSWWYLGRKKIIVRILGRYIELKPDLKILDLGCGTGGTTLALSNFGMVYGTDWSLPALKQCSRRGLDKVVNVSAVKLPFLAETFDIITVLDVIEHIKDEVEVLRELSYVLKKDGIILIAVPAFQFLWSNHDIAVSHLRRYKSKSLGLLVAEAGLQCVRVTYAISFLFPLLAIYRMSGKLNKSTNKTPKADRIRLPTLLNNLLKQTLFLESKIIQKINLPFGLSLLCIAKKYNE